MRNFYILFHWEQAIWNSTEALGRLMVAKGNVGAKFSET